MISGVLACFFLPPLCVILKKIILSCRASSIQNSPDDQGFESSRPANCLFEDQDQGHPADPPINLVPPDGPIYNGWQVVDQTAVDDIDSIIKDSRHPISASTRGILPPSVLLPDSDRVEPQVAAPFDRHNEGINARLALIHENVYRF
jgi:hypothetical protein